MRIWLDPLKMTALGITASDVVNAVTQQNVQAVAGQIGQPPEPVLDGPPQYVNLAGLRLIGLDNADEARRLSVLDFIPMEDRVAVRDDYWRTVTETGRWRGVIRFHHFKSGNATPLLMDWFLIDDRRTGKPVVMATVSRDLTPQKRWKRSYECLTRGLSRRSRHARKHLARPTGICIEWPPREARPAHASGNYRQRLFHAGRCWR
jgi:hypothetical protein